MATKVNVVLDDDVKAELEKLVDAGLRSRVINNALRKELMMIRRQKLSARLDELRSKTKRVSTREIVDLIRRDRGRS
jgi:predicted transcriptional regulator